MNKRKILIALLFVLPLLVIMIANGPTGVLVFDGESTAYHPWLHLVSESGVGWCAPLAILLNYAVFALAVVYALKKKEWCARSIRNIAAIAGFLAVLPNMIRADVMVIPNVFGAIALFADAVAAELLLRETAAVAGKNSEPQRLKRR